MRIRAKYPNSDGDSGLACLLYYSSDITSGAVAPMREAEVFAGPAVTLSKCQALNGSERLSRLVLSTALHTQTTVSARKPFQLFT